MRRSHLARAVLSVLFIGLLATPLVIRHLSAERERVPANDVSLEEALERYGFHLEEVARSSGIEFRHRAPNLDEELDHIMPMVASLGASVSIVDFDRDGWQDLYVTDSGEGARNALYRNVGDGTFEDVATELGADARSTPQTGVSMGSVWGDYDNDGYEDLFLYRWGRPELFRNQQGTGFERVTSQARLPDWINANTALWFDYDRDGHLDLFVGGYYPEEIDLREIPTTRIMPESFEYADNGGRNYLLRNRGDGTFQDVSKQVGIESRRWTLAAVAGDLRGTGYPDLYVANEFGVDELLLNEKGQRFVAAGDLSGIGFAPKAGMNATFGDVLNSGALAIYVSNISEPGVLIQGNNLWFPEGSDGELRYRNLAGAMGVEFGGWSYGAQFGDLNNDGHLDLYLVNGFISADRRNSYWYDFSLVAGGNRTVISDAANWPSMKGRSLSGYQRSRVWVNDGAGRFEEASAVVGATDLYDGRSVALADLWNRGVLDIVVANQRGPLLIYRNRVRSENDWIAFELEGTRSNSSAIGALVEVFWNDQQQVQIVSGGSGFSAQNMRRLHFGLGPAADVEKAVVRWPSGRVQTIDSPEIRTVHRIREQE